MPSTLARNLIVAVLFLALILPSPGASSVQQHAGLISSKPGQPVNLPIAHVPHWDRSSIRPANLPYLGASLPTEVAYTLNPSNFTLEQGLGKIDTAQAESASADPATGTVYTGGAFDVFALDPTNGSLLATLPDNPGNSTVGSNPEEMAFDDATHTVWVADWGYGVTAFNMTTHARVHAIPLPDGPKSIAFDNLSNTIISVGVFNGTITVFNATTGAVLRTDAAFGTSGYQVVQYALFDYLSNFLYVLNQGVYVFNASTLSLVKEITAAGSPFEAVLDPVAKAVVVGGPGSPVVFAINATTNTVWPPSGGFSIGGGAGAGALAYNPNRAEIYASPGGSSPGFGIAILSASNFSYLGEVNTSPMSPIDLAYAGPQEALLGIDGNLGFLIVNGTTDSIVTPILPFAVHYEGEAYDAVQQRLYVATADSGDVCGDPGTLTVLSVSQHPALVARVQVGYGPYHVLVDPADSLVFVTNSCSNTVSVVNLSSATPTTTVVIVGPTPTGLAYDPRSGTVFVACSGNDSIWKVNTTSLHAARFANLSSGANPSDVRFDPQMNALLIAEFGAAGLVVLNATTGGRVGSTIPVGLNPYAIDVDTATGRIYVANSGGSNLSVLNSSTLRGVGSIPVDASPSSIAEVKGGTSLYVTSYSNATVDIVNATSETRIPGSIHVAATPIGITYDPVFNQADVIHEGSGALTVLANAPRISGDVTLPSVTEVGAPVQVYLQVVNGTPPYSGEWTATAGNCTQAALVATCSFASSGMDRVSFRVVDAAGYSTWGSIADDVVSRLSLLRFDSTSPSVDVGQNFGLSVRLTGGIGPVGLVYYGLPPGCPASASFNLSCSPTAPGDYQITAVSTDSRGVIAATSVVVDVYPTLVIENFSAVPYPVYLGQHLVLDTVVAGGSSTPAFRYTGLPVGCASINASVLTCEPAAPVNGTASVSVTDSNGEVASTSVAFQVARPPPLSVAIRANPANGTSGYPFMLRASLTGGVAPFSYSYSGLPAGCTSANLSLVVCTPASSGSYSVRVRAADAIGQTANASVALSVSGPVGPRGGSSGPPVGWEIGGVAAAGGVGLFLGLWFGRRSGSRRIPRQKAENPARTEVP